MGGFIGLTKRILPALVLLCTLCSSGCARFQINTEGLPPILAQDELLRPYEKAATVVVTRNRYGSPEDLTPADYSWAYAALRREAARIGADGVILPEVSIELHRYIFYPTSHIKARGIAIKFR